MELIPTKAYYITVDGVIKEIRPENGTDFRLEEAQGFVDGYIEIVWLSTDQIIIINEEGKFNKEYNAIATGIAELHKALLAGDYICGDVIICPAGMLK